MPFCFARVFRSKPAQQRPSDDPLQGLKRPTVTNVCPIVLRRDKVLSTSVNCPCRDRWGGSLFLQVWGRQIAYIRSGCLPLGIPLEYLSIWVIFVRPHTTTPHPPISSLTNLAPNSLEPSQVISFPSARTPLPSVSYRAVSMVCSQCGHCSYFIRQRRLYLVLMVCLSIHCQAY